MNIIELAKEAGFTDYYPERLTRFAALVRAEALAEHKCGGCAKTAADGWALYCVECWEKTQPQGEPVGCLNVTKWKGLENYDFDYYGSLPDGAYTLYATPPSVEAAIEATKEATKERAARICDVVLGDNEVSAVIRSMK